MTSEVAVLLDKQLPHKPFRPILGNFYEIAREEAISPYERWIREYQSSIIAYHGMMGSVRIMVADPDFMKHILVTNVRNYPKPKFLFARLQEVIGNGLVTSEGQLHASHRKLCNGSFKPSILQNFVPIVEKYCQQLCEKWMEQVAADPEAEYITLAPTDGFTCMSLDAIGECGFGYKFNSLVRPDAGDVMSFQRMLGVFGFSWKLLIPFFTKLPTKEKRQWDQDLAVVDSCVTTVIAEKKKSLSEITDDEHVHDLLTSLLLAKDEDSGEGLSEKEIRDHVMTFMVAGHETTSSGLLWCLLSLGRHPEIQDKLRAEVSAIDGPLTWDTLDRLKYLTAVVKETLRLYPPVSLTFRKAKSDDQYKGMFIPKDMVVNLAIGALHRNPKHWEDPLEFKPERFLSESGIMPYTFLPFIAGPRMCIGYKFALMEMKVTLAILLRKLEFRPVPGITYKKKQRLTMRPNPSLELRVSRVKN
ncbi:taurochenodeoxycholic 6 alpha-hydroxylase-like isoform X2 [Liolophura sinensis]|uniref:taurochenodeoxycholic 6 alpha-hydroxylase-like isoform X2 n=1 Tax=Liolophura sinensis TaxID=3198878 RepID=UPI00315808E4